MARKYLNRAGMTTATVGTGAITLGAAIQSAALGYFQTFAAAGIADGDTVGYFIEDGANWEVGIGTYTSAGTVLTRTTVQQSTNGGAAISLSGSAVVFVTAVASDFEAFATKTGTETLSGKTLVDPVVTGTIKEDVYTITDAAGFEIDPGNGSIQKVTLGANRTPAATNFQDGESVTLKVADGAGYTITWSTIGVVWVDGAAPTLATSGWTFIELWKVDGTVYGKGTGDVAS